MNDYITRDKWIKNCNEKQLENCNFIINQSGNFEFITDEELTLLNGCTLTHPLFERLENKQLIITENNTKDVFKTYNQWNKRKYESGNPFYVVEITDNCNLRCVYCSANTSANTTISS